MKQQAPKETDRLTSLEKAVFCAQVASAHKAENPLIFHVAEIVSFTDYSVICSGRSTRHVQAIAEHIEAALRQRRVRAMGREGLSEGQWILLDFGDVIVHVFYQAVRAYYDLEGLWWEARQVEFSENPNETA